ncbi:VanZ family protein [Streptococcus loxodontisalivarius]|uniref:Glycopeptide antibiotics resistance protein n=1 Tax=Streptococcus loxodontisalivarius TaxID=1349415 RepID=A0ABS2PSQ7_9STRE|nr:VanZ family protein [Streptococcus loxodontisalivarius]MBM7642585.1 glycopeptide antibiotics resistance protein [Streptococcus loxodontisalivarius]
MALLPKNLSSTWTRIVSCIAIVYTLFICLLCFSPQWGLADGVTTPNIIYWGRLRLLLVPFNSLVSAGQLTSLKEIIWVFGQNLSNVFLLYPLGLCLVFLRKEWRSVKSSLLYGFLISLGIETGQILVDLLYDANRVFEIDDLWTNSLGVLLAYLTYRLLTGSRKTD